MTRTIDLTALGSAKLIRACSEGADQLILV